MRRTVNPNSYRGWRRRVFERDGYKCVLCGANERLEADHIIPYSADKSLHYSLENGRTLCNPCHRKTDTYGGRARTWNKGIKK